MPHLFVIYGDRERETIIFLGKFETVRQIIDYTGGTFTYADRKMTNRKYLTYKNHFQIFENIKRT